VILDFLISFPSPCAKGARDSQGRASLNPGRGTADTPTRLSRPPIAEDKGDRR
jgi:hypothetical protein